jgi:hypothetical protein
VTVTINPVNPVCTQPPPVAAVTSPATGCATATAAVNTDGTTTITIRNSASAGAQSLNVTAGTPTPGPAAPGFEISPTGQVTIPPGGSSVWVVTFHAGATAGSTAGTVSFTTNDPNNPALSVCLTGNATP